MKEARVISYAEAIKCLADTPDIHTFVNPAANMLVGCDWARDKVLEVLRLAPEIYISGDHAKNLKHGLACEDDGRMIFIETAILPDDLPKDPAAPGPALRKENA